MRSLRAREELDRQLKLYYREEGPLGRNKVLYRRLDSGLPLICRTPPPDTDLSVFRRLVGRSHRNLAAVYDVIEDEESPAVLLEYVPGRSLAEILRDEPPEEAAVKRIALDVCDGLSALHSLEIVHKDLKPENVIVQEDGISRLIDYGIATIFGDNRPAETALLGTVGFAAPEQFGFNRTDARTDIYAFGVLLNVLLAHEHPTARQYREGRPGKIIRRCLHTGPEDRYPSAYELRKDLMKW